MCLRLELCGSAHIRSIRELCVGPLTASPSRDDDCHGILMLAAMSTVPACAVAAERIDEVIHAVFDRRNQCSRRKCEHRGVICFSHVNFRYPNAQEDVSLTLTLLVSRERRRGNHRQYRLRKVKHRQPDSPVTLRRGIVHRVDFPQPVFADDCRAAFGAHNKVNVREHILLRVRVAEVRYGKNRSRRGVLLSSPAALVPSDRRLRADDLINTLRSHRRRGSDNRHCREH